MRWICKKWYQVPASARQFAADAGLFMAAYYALSTTLKVIL